MSKEIGFTIQLSLMGRDLIILSEDNSVESLRSLGST